MRIRLIQNGNLEVIDRAICKCHDKELGSCSIEERLARIERVGNKMKHASVLEHVNYSFDIDGISRACLQELARHRIASYTVKSSRYTLDELKKESAFVQGINYNKKEDKYTYIFTRNAMQRASKYLVMTKEERVNTNNIVKLDMLRISVHSGVANDMSKFELPEAYKTSLVMSINIRSLQNFIKLRTHQSALWEIQLLAKALYDVLPEQHKYLFADVLEHDLVDVKMTKEQYKDWQNIEQEKRK